MSNKFKYKVEINGVEIKEGDVIDGNFDMKDIWEGVKKVRCVGKVTYLDRKKMEIDCSKVYESKTEVIEFYELENAVLKVLNK